MENNTVINRLARPFYCLFNLDLYDLFVTRLPLAYRRGDAWVHLMALFILISALIVRLANGLTNDYVPLPVAQSLVVAIPGLVFIWATGMITRTRLPRLGLFLTSFSQAFLFVQVVVYAIASIVVTPFPTIDSTLLALDQWLGFDTLSALQWAHYHPYFKFILQQAYNTWFWQLLLTPMLLALYKDELEINRYFVATFVSFFVAGMIYYFAPTVAPAGVLSSPYFTQEQHNLVLAFFQVHQHQPVTVALGGLIAFPSCHIINTTLALIAWRRRKLMFYPLIIVNVFLALATLYLGYHYLVDIIAGYLIAGLSYWFATWLLAKPLRFRH